MQTAAAASVVETQGQMWLFELEISHANGHETGGERFRDFCLESRKRLALLGKRGESGSIISLAARLAADATAIQLGLSLMT